MKDHEDVSEYVVFQETPSPLASLIPLKPMNGFQDGDAYEVVDVDGSHWLAHLVCTEDGWYCIADDGSRSWFLVSLWYWSALAHRQHWVGDTGATCGELYRVGTAAPSAVEDVEQLMQLPTMLLIDIRYAARSRWRPSWNKSALQARWGSRYTHERGLSNGNYKDNGKPIALVAPDSSVDGAADLLWKGYSLLLLCACRGDDETCHCQMVASLIVQRFTALKRERSLLAKLAFWRKGEKGS
ncbi:MAG: hypothetical protein ACYDER_18825 [Ktedonobacteraceae bacterium]